MELTQESDRTGDSRRLFFGAQVEASWPKDYPPARIIPEKTRHITLAFLGQGSFSKLQDALDSVPVPSFRIGPSGIADSLIFLPPEKSRVAALSVNWCYSQAQLEIYQRSLLEWLESKNYSTETRPFFPHISIARAPFDKDAWIEHFHPLPFYIKAICLYQSLGNLQYQSLWEIPLLLAFEEFEHTADIAFYIRGTTMQELHANAQIALAFKFPLIIQFFATTFQNSLDEIIISLNDVIAKADTELGCPFKAVSFHGKIKTDVQNGLLWEMIVDV
jgi:2'-5' RNA ligase